MRTPPIDWSPPAIAPTREPIPKREACRCGVRRARASSGHGASLVGVTDFTTPGFRGDPQGGRRYALSARRLVALAHLGRQRDAFTGLLRGRGRAGTLAGLLQPPHLRIAAVGGEQGGVSTALDDAARL